MEMFREHTGNVSDWLALKVVEVALLTKLPLKIA